MDTSENTMLGVFGESARQRVEKAIGQIVDYIRAKYPKWEACPAADLRGWLLWHWCQGLVAPILAPDSDKLVALVVVRLFDEPAGYETAYLHNPRGRICYVELAIADTKDALKVAVECLRERFGAPVYLMRDRPLKGLSAKIFLWRRYGRLLENQNVNS